MFRVLCVYIELDVLRIGCSSCTRSESRSIRIPFLFIAGNARFTYIDMSRASFAERQIAFHEPGKFQEVS